MTDYNFQVEATSDTPLFLIDRKAGSIHIKGVSMPENAYEFFDPLEKMALLAFGNFTGELKMEVEIAYLNSMSGKQLLKLIRLLGAKHSTLKVKWKYGKGDDLIRIKGEEIRTICAPIEVTVEALS
jgi:hypothetical protein